MASRFYRSSITGQLNLTSRRGIATQLDLINGHDITSQLDVKNQLVMANQGGMARHRYRGSLQALVLDWSGTIVDRYAIAPTEAFRGVFLRQGVEITPAEARAPMGLRKDLHIKSIAQDDAVFWRWNQRRRLPPSESIFREMYEDYTNHQVSIMPRYCDLLPGVAEVSDEIRKRFGVKLGTTTGFPGEVVETILEEVRLQGYQPDAAVASDQVENGTRPKPFMLYRNLEMMDISPIQSVLKVDDTVSGIEEGRSAGCWTLGLSRYSSYMEIDSLEDEQSLTSEQLTQKNKKSAAKLWRAGAHYVIDDFYGLPDVILDINERLARGETPIA